MNEEMQEAETLRAVEMLMLEKFRSEPFHNLRMMYGDHVSAVVPGGTCSDKTLSFLRAARQAGFDTALHSAFIDGEEKHRLARVSVGRRTFFADIGDGWPALQLFPADREVAFRCFGIGFRTELSNSRLAVFCERNGREALQLEIEILGRPEQEILADVERRFNSGIAYPFSNSVRFSLVVGDRFLFLRGDRLEIHSIDTFEELAGIEKNDVPRVIYEYFGYDLHQVLSRAGRDAHWP